MTIAVDRAFSADIWGFLILFGFSGVLALYPFIKK
jgi:hypothetical protein